MRISGDVVEELVKSPGSWLSMRKATGIAISSRVRLARNVAGSAFPGWAGEEERVGLCSRLQEVIGKMDTLPNPTFLDMGALDAMQKDVLQERHLISYEIAQRGRGSAVAVADDEGLAIMINEEDHLRLQAIAPGMQLREIWHKLDSVDSEIETRVEYAFSDKLGYLTACPSNVGTGLRASVMVHLAGLRLLNEVEPVVRGLEKLGLTVRGLFGEGTEAYGNMFQISNQQTLGESEDALVEGLIERVEEVIGHEEHARRRIEESRGTYLADVVARARGILLNCRVLMSQEAVELLSALRLGVELGLVGNLKVGRLNEIMLLTQPGHLQTIANRVLAPEERDQLRARMVRDKLKGTSLLV